MIKRDRELLACAARINQNFGAAVSRLMLQQDGGELPADELRAIGTALRELAADFLARASELDGRTVHPPSRVIVEERSE